jgi:KDO2-lipid IV(A) lauroyltransferase
LGAVREWLYYAIALPAAALLPPRLGWALTLPLARLKAPLRSLQLAARRQALEDVLQLPAPALEQTVQRGLRLEVWEEIESLQYYLWSRRSVRRRFHATGLEHLDRAISAGRGAILMTGHYGLLCSGLVALGLRGYPLAYLSNDTPRDLSLPRAVRFHSRIKISGMKRRGRGRFVYLDLTRPARSSTGPLRRLVAELKQGGVAVVLLDVSPQLAGATSGARLLGRPCRFPVGIPWLARVSGAPILPFFALRSEDREEILIEPPLAVTGSLEHDLQLCAGALERHVLRDPAQWMSWEIWPHFAAAAAPNPRA